MIIECMQIPPHENIHLTCCSQGQEFGSDAAFGIIYIGGVCCASRTGSEHFPNILSSGWYLSSDYFASYCRVEFCPFCGSRVPSLG